MRRKFGFLLLLLFFVCIACNPSLPSKETMGKNASFSSAKLELYSVSIDVPKQVKLNEVFTIKASLLNLGDNQIMIRHAARIFYFSIKNSNGKQVNTFGMKGVGEISTLKIQEPATEDYNYKLDTSGYYEVSAIAKFTIGEGENLKEYEFETNRSVIEVIP
ncbi:hypothetical protein P5G65_09180 [Paenibacillus chondroitinus]|uniref:Intracellular proteinase inhibitor BsuPI domain-containing protein n=1 Tax=Paenibacillus chondroitinus TaxID=59842 RepID=A0ABU6D8J6_9BACL|nr:MULTISPECIES: hypothetical protein [Paenibacillus]MCY9659754.1 hypothetical protein [Paenibacillus anseongense]MEB4794067.1 hypothetical protein [Paenibacillus chondroitinus]